MSRRGAGLQISETETKPHNDLNDPARYDHIRRAILEKPALYEFYKITYLFFRDRLDAMASAGTYLEVGSGAGFLKRFVPEAVTSDTLPYKGVDRVVDALNLPYGDGELQAIMLFNTFHHIADVERFLSEAQRTLRKGGRILIADQHVGIISYLLLKYVHKEGFDAKPKQWGFTSSGPLSGANGALAWVVFCKERQKFHSLFPGLKLCYYRTHSPLLYWASGGLESSLTLPRFLLKPILWLDWFLVKLSRHFGSFCFIEVEKT